MGVRRYGISLRVEHEYIINVKQVYRMNIKALYRQEKSTLIECT